MKFLQQKLPNLLNNDFCLSFSCNVIGKFKKNLEIWSVVLFFCAILIGREKRCDLEQKIVRFGNKSHRWEPITLQG